MSQEQYNFLDELGLGRVIDNSKEKFATKFEVNKVKEDTDTYVFNIDYENILAFDTSYII